MSEDKRPILGISVGDPGGIGPEISAKTLNREGIYEHCRPLLVADCGVMEDALGFTDVNLKLNPVQDVRDAIFKHGTIDVLDMDNMPINLLRYKEVTAD
jgi:4-hydroxy-L-threonine phosphate dehydrogenase PdxA